jgi:hypothetical protein
MGRDNSRFLIPVRVSAHFYMGAYAVFDAVPPRKPGIASSGNDLDEGLEQVLHGSRVAYPTNTLLTGTFTTFETIFNQPNKEPVLQNGVARSIIASLGEVGGFDWSLRHKSRTRKQGWQVDYFCQDSRENRDRKQNSLRRWKPGSNRTIGRLSAVSIVLFCDMTIQLELINLGAYC